MSSRQTYNSRVLITGDVSNFRKENTTQFQQSKVAFKEPQLVLNADLPLSERRDEIDTSNNATVTKQGAEYRVRATSDANSNAKLKTRQRGNYISGSVFEPGMGIRIPNQPTGDAFIRWGYFNGNAGLFFPWDADGLSVNVKSGGTVVEQVFQENWNIDNFSGDGPNNNNPSGVELDPTDGNIYQIPFAYYGYGGIDFEVGYRAKNDRYIVTSVHQVKMKGTVSVDTPNLPLAIEVDSGTTGTQLDCFVGGRQMSPLGQQDNIFRSTEATRINRSITTSFRPLISLRHKTDFEVIPVRLGGIEFISDSDGIFEIQRNATLDGDASFTYTGNQTEAEKAVEIDVSAGDTFSSGEAIYRGTFNGGEGSKIQATSSDLPRRPISELDTITVAARTVSGSGSLTCIFRTQEDW